MRDTLHRFAVWLKYLSLICTQSSNSLKLDVFIFMWKTVNQRTNSKMAGGYNCHTVTLGFMEGEINSKQG